MSDLWRILILVGAGLLARYLYRLMQNRRR
jgi:hypothetical protein